MSKLCSFLEGMALGVAVGMGVAIAGKLMMNNDKKTTKGKNQLEKAVTEFVDGIETLIKQKKRREHYVLCVLVLFVKF